MKSKPLPDQQILLECLEYSKITGKLFWKNRPESSFKLQEGRTPQHIANAWNANWAGKPAFTSISKNGYHSGAFNNESFYAHRIIYKMVYGVDPLDIDHEDGNRQNNVLTNLISKDRGGNLKNRRLSKNNTSGFHGVSYSKRHKLWSVSIYDNNKPIHLGWFKNKDEAVNARKEAEKLYDYHENHGRT